MQIPQERSWMRLRENRFMQKDLILSMEQGMEWVIC